MSIDWAVVSAGIQCILVIIGVLMTIYEPLVQKYRWYILTTFLVLGVVGMVATILESQQSSKQSKESAEQISHANSQLVSSLQNIERLNAETARLQLQNTELQQKLLAQSESALKELSEQNAQLQNRTLRAATGGDSFCVLVPVFYAESGRWIRLGLQHHGDFPLYDIRISMVYPGSPSLRAMVPSFSPSKVPRTMEFQIPPLMSGAMRFSAYFEARNGYWHQFLFVSRVAENRLAIATRVTNVGPAMESRVGPVKVLYEFIDKDFPRDKGDKVDWVLEKQ